MLEIGDRAKGAARHGKSWEEAQGNGKGWCRFVRYSDSDEMLSTPLSLSGERRNVHD